MNIPHGLKNENEIPETLLALDIGTEYIKALIANVQGEDIEIVGVGRAHQERWATCTRVRLRIFQR